MSTKNGDVKAYVKATYTTTTNFPVGEICCMFCQYRRRREFNKHTRYICSLTYECLTDSDFTIGYDCPLTFEEKDGE